MTNASESSTKSDCSISNDINLFDQMVALVRRWRMILGITCLTAIISAGIATRMPPVYSSTAKLLMLEFSDQTDVVRVGNDGKLVRGNIKGVWKPSDISVIKGVFESTPMRQVVGKTAGGSQCTVQVKQEKQLGFLTVKVEGSSREATVRVAAATVNEAAQLAFRMGLLSSPVIVLDETPHSDDGSAMVLRLMEQPEIGVQIRPRRSMIVLLSAVTGLFCSILIAIVLEYFRNLSGGDRNRLAEFKVAVTKNKADKSATDKT